MIKKILLYSEWFDPENCLKGIDFAKEITKRGYKVYVLTTFPNYPGGKIFPGYSQKINHIEYCEGIKIIRVPIYPSHDNSSWRRALTYISFSITSFLRGLFFLNEIDIIYCYHPPISTGFVAILWKLLFKIPVVLDVQDLWPESLVATGFVKNRFLINLINQFCLKVYKNVDQLVVISKGFQKYFNSLEIDKNKIKIIRNWTFENEFSTSEQQILPKEFFNSNKFKILFAGNIGIAQEIKTIISTAKIINDKNIDIDFFVIGDGIDKEKSKKFLFKQNITNFFFLPKVSARYIQAYLKFADVLLIHLKSEPLFKITIPSKLQSYLYIGKPILGAIEGEASEIIKYSRSGIIAKPSNPNSIAKAAIKLSKTSKNDLLLMGRNGSNFYNRNLSMKKGVDEFIRIFEELKK